MSPSTTDRGRTARSTEKMHPDLDPVPSVARRENHATDSLTTLPTAKMLIRTTGPKHTSDFVHSRRVRAAIVTRTSTTSNNTNALLLAVKNRKTPAESAIGRPAGIELVRAR